MQRAFRVGMDDDVAVALTAIRPGPVEVLGASIPSLNAREAIEQGHKIALHAIACGQTIKKYQVVIGRAKCAIAQGSWVHLHNMDSLYAERSTTQRKGESGNAKDIEYA